MDTWCAHNHGTHKTFSIKHSGMCSSLILSFVFHFLLVSPEEIQKITFRDDRPCKVEEEDEDLFCDELFAPVDFAMDQSFASHSPPLDGRGAPPPPPVPSLYLPCGAPPPVPRLMSMSYHPPPPAGAPPPPPPPAYTSSSLGAAAPPPPPPPSNISAKQFAGVPPIPSLRRTSFGFNASLNMPGAPPRPPKKQIIDVKHSQKDGKSYSSVSFARSIPQSELRARDRSSWTQQEQQQQQVYQSLTVSSMQPAPPPPPLRKAALPKPKSATSRFMPAQPQLLGRSSHRSRELQGAAPKSSLAFNSTSCM